MKNILEINNLKVEFKVDDGIVEAVNNISIAIAEGETLGLVGETGAGKTTTAKAIMKLIPTPPGKVVSGEIFFEGENILPKTQKQMESIRGGKISMIFQDPMTSLNPIFTIGNQVAEVIRLHEKSSRAEANKKAAEMLELVGIPAERFEEYPHQFSGGMRQRVVIAIAIACSPKLLIADEPTTALDVTIQAQVLDLMRKLQSEMNTSVLLITHDLGVVAEICDKVAIMYAGEIVEYGTLEDIFEKTSHPYTIGLFNSIPDLEADVDTLHPIKGLTPDPSNLPKGCKFHERCDKVMDICKTENPQPVSLDEFHVVKCHLFCEGGSR